MRPGRILVLAVILLAASAGCATRKDALLPHGNKTMSDLWSQYSGPADGSFADVRLVKARQTLLRPLNDQEAKSALSHNISYTRTAASEIDREFKRLPDPDLIMYVFPHLTGRNPVPIPGYSTVFPFYSEVHYAMPGDRQAEY
ncbi:MAG: TIGR03751 family conjugal transfer lipoprotein [Gammaproteobacteria bacterium]|nr:TIGR03751 family conjugal transfer lipoprotein [Gammaproteobacteria bacterium]